MSILRDRKPKKHYRRAESESLCGFKIKSEHLTTDKESVSCTNCKTRMTGTSFNDYNNVNFNFRHL